MKGFKNALVFLFAAFLVVLLSLSVNAEQVALTGQDNADNEDGTGVERNLNSGAFSVVVTLSGGSMVSYTDSTVVAPTAIGAPDNVYCYRVFAFNAAGSSGYSNTACKTFAAPKLQPPSAPSLLKTAGTTNSSITLGWRDNADNETSQEIALAQSAPPRNWTVPVDANATTSTIKGLRKNTQYNFKVRSVGDGGVSAYSNAVTATTVK